MDGFGQSAWADEKFSRNYLERADVYIVERRKMFALAGSFFQRFLAGRNGVRMVDLGCGDGVLTHEILKQDGTVAATLVDGSQDMLYRADERLGMYGNVRFVKASFQELIDGAVELEGGFDFAVSSLAIHHLPLEKKTALFRYIHERLLAGGGFVNVDVVLAPSEELEKWYFALWKEWMHAMQARLGMEGDVEEVIRQYKDPASMNRPDTLEAQLEALRDAGFSDVDCYYKNGIFAVFGGRK